MVKVLKRPTRGIRKRSPELKRTKTLLPHIGELTAPVMIILDPFVGNTNFKAPLTPNHFNWFVGHLRDNGGFKKEDVCIISCSMPVDKETWELGKLINDHLKTHRPELLDIINKNKPKLVLPFGAKACQQVIGRAVQITKVRGQPFSEPDIIGGINVLPMLSPFFARRQPENEAAFAADLRTAGRIYTNNFDIEASAIDYKHDYKWCWDVAELKKLLRGRKQLSVDIESVGLQGFKPDTALLTIQICYDLGKSIIIPINYDRGKYRHHKFIPWDKIDRAGLIRTIKKTFEDPRVEIFGQNFKFDWLFLWYKLGIKVSNYAHDTMLLAHLHDENQRRINIDDLVRQHVPEMAGFNDGLNNDPDHHEKSRMDLLPPDKMLPYGCGDTDAAWRLKDNLLQTIGSDEKLMKTYDHVTMPAMRAFCHIELNGFPVSQPALVAFEKRLRFIQKKERIWLLKQIPKSIKDKHKDTGVGLKVTRAAILVDWLYKHKDGLKLKPVKYTKTKQPSISSKEALPYYVADHPVLARLIDYIKNDKLLNTYAKGFHKYIYDSIIRPSYSLTSTVTGRSASRDPNGQNFPKRGKLAKDYRKVFEAPKGWVFIQCDLSQAELRIAAMMSGDENMLNVYREGGDIHRTTAAGTMGLTVDEFLALPKATQDMKRFQAKAVNFGFLYGMWWVKFRSYAKTDYGIEFTEEEAKDIRDNFFRTYPMLEQWHNDVQSYVMDKGYIRTFDGRIRHLPNVFSPDEGTAKQAQRQAINSPVQAIASDLGLMTLGRLMPYIQKMKFDWIKPCGFIHDAIVCLVREDKVAHGCDLVKRFMENNPLQEWFDWTPEIPITADAEIGRTLADTHELKPTQFVGRQNRHKTFNDLLTEERDALLLNIANEADDDRKAKLVKQVNELEANIALSGNIPSRPRFKSATIKIKRRGTSRAKTQATKTYQRRSVGVHKTNGGSKRKIQRRKPPENKAA